MKTKKPITAKRMWALMKHGWPTEYFTQKQYAHNKGIDRFGRDWKFVVLPVSVIEVASVSALVEQVAEYVCQTTNGCPLDDVTCGCAQSCRDHAKGFLSSLNLIPARRRK